MLKRKIDKRPEWNVTIDEPVAGNYYPVTNMISIKDNDPSKVLTVLTDRSEGGSSLVEGNIELMLHRRLLHDDAFGVGEALNESAQGVGLVTRITHRFSTESDQNQRKHAIQVGLHPSAFVSDANNLNYDDWLKLKNEYSWLNTKLPEGIHLLTLEPWGKDILMRLENILEDSTLEVDIGSILKNIKVKSIKETTLAANQWINDHKQWEWNTEERFVKNFNEKYGSFDKTKYSIDTNTKLEDNGLKISLRANQIRTFVVNYDYVKEHRLF